MKKYIVFFASINICFFANTFTKLVEIIQQDTLARKLETQEKTIILVGMTHCPWCESMKKKINTLHPKQNVYYANGITLHFDSLITKLCQANENLFSPQAKKKYPEYIKNNIFQVPGYPILLKIEQGTIQDIIVGGTSPKQLQTFLS